MGRTKNIRPLVRFYEIPRSESVLALPGEARDGRHAAEAKRPHVHNLMEVGVCRAGEGVLALDGRETAYEAGMVTVIPAGCVHRAAGGKKELWELFYLDPVLVLSALYPDNTLPLWEKLAAAGRRALLLRPEEAPALTATAAAILREMAGSGPYYREIVRNLVTVFLLQLIRLNEDAPAGEEPEAPCLSQIRPAILYIRDHYRESLRASELAARCSLSETHFRRLFAESLNMPPMDYLNLVRVRRACELMDRKDFPMELVAAECGFASISAFNRNFKKFMRISPYQWKLGRTPPPEGAADAEAYHDIHG